MKPSFEARWQPSPLMLGSDPEPITRRDPAGHRGVILSLATSALRDDSTGPLFRTIGRPPQASGRGPESPGEPPGCLGGAIPGPQGVSKQRLRPYQEADGVSSWCPAGGWP